MKFRMIAAVLTAQALIGAQTVSAAEILNHRLSVPDRGGFAGARLRIPFNGGERPRAGLAVAPMQRARETGAIGLGSGLELGLSTRGKLEFAAAGRTLRLGQKHKSGVSTLGWVGIGVGAALVAGTALFVYAMNHCPDYADEC